MLRYVGEDELVADGVRVRLVDGRLETSYGTFEPQG